MLKVSMRSKIAQDLRRIFSAADREEADCRLVLMVQKYRELAPKLAEWLEANVSQRLTTFSPRGQCVDSVVIRVTPRWSGLTYWSGA